MTKPLRSWVIYTLEDPRSTGSVRYVGVTHKRPKGRLRDHVLRAEKSDRDSHSVAWIRSLLKDGVEPLMRVIYEGTGPEWAPVEVWWIAWHRERGFDLTNHTLGGEGNVGYTPSATARAKMSAAKKGKPRSRESVLKQQAAMRTPEVRAKMSASHKGQKPSAETLAKRSAALKGRKQSPEHVAKRTSGQIGKKRDPAIGLKVAASNRSRKQSPESIAKRSASLRGLKRSPEIRAQMSVRAQAREARKKLLKSCADVCATGPVELSDPSA